MEGKDEEDPQQNINPSSEQPAPAVEQPKMQSDGDDEPESTDYVGMESREEGEEKDPNQQQELEREKEEHGEGVEEVTLKEEPGELISEQEKGWIIKEAMMQRIGGTYDFFAGQIAKYSRHLQSRKNVLESIYDYIDKNKIIKAHTAILLKDYFRSLADICESFHEKSYKYEFRKKEESENVLVNMGAELREGFHQLFNMRKDVGNQHSRIFKLIKTTTLPNLEKVFEKYYGTMNIAQKKLQAKKDAFKSKEGKIQKRIDKIRKVYEKGRYGDEANEDVFVEMIKFLKEERELRSSIFDWSKELQTLRKAIIVADYELMTNVDSILSEYKHFNEAGFRPKKKKHQFHDCLKQEIEDRYLYERMVTPVDNDYILAIINFRKKKNLTLLKQDQYKQYLEEQFFGSVIGDLKELLKGTITKVFPLKNPEEDLVRTASGNLVIYNKKTLEVRNKLAIESTMAEFRGQGRVELTEKIKGIIFDSTNSETVVFGSEDRAEEVMIYLTMELGQQES